MHILLVHNNYGKFSGEENAVQAMAKVLGEKGHTVTWFTRNSADIGHSISKRIQAFFSGIYSFSSKKSIEQILDEVRIDLVQVQNLYPFISPSVLQACKARKIPVVMRCPNYRLFCPNGLHLTHGKVCERCLGGREWNCVVQNCEGSFSKSVGYAVRNAFARKTRMILDNVTVFLVLSEFQRQRFINGGIPGERIVILPNIAPDVSGEPVSSLGEFISFVGRVSPEKGIYQFLEAAQALPKIAFAVAGSTNAIPEIQLNAPGNVTFKGFLQGDPLENFFRKSKVLVFPGLWFEGFPNVIAHAMAYGKPIIASRIGAIPELVDDGVTGLLFEPGHVKELAAKIKYLKDRPDICRKMGKAGLEKAKREYSKESYYGKLSAAYVQAIKLNSYQMV